MLESRRVRPIAQLVYVRPRTSPRGGPGSGTVVGMESARSVNELPPAPAVYAMYGGAGREYVAYVGLADNLRRRVNQHLVNRDSSVTTGTSAAGLNPDHIRAVEWWTVRTERRSPQLNWWRSTNSNPLSGVEAASRRQHRGSERRRIPRTDQHVARHAVRSTRHPAADRSHRTPRRA
jgi:hypothetical protein